MPGSRLQKARHHLDFFQQVVPKGPALLTSLVHSRDFTHLSIAVPMANRDLRDAPVSIVIPHAMNHSTLRLNKQMRREMDQSSLSLCKMEL